MIYFAGLLALVWGVVWAAVLQFVRLGQFLAARRTWITVVVGVGVSLLIALLVVPWDVVLRVTLVLGLASLGIIARSLWNELREQDEVADVLEDQIS